MGAQPEVFALQPQGLVPAEPLLTPVLEPLGVLARLAEPLQLHHLQFPKPEDEVSSRDLIAKAAADLGNAEGNPLPRAVDHVLEVDEDPLRGLGPEVDHCALVVDRADEGLEHEVELTRLAERTPAVGTGGPLQLVRAPALMALAEAVNQRITEVGEMARRLPHRGIHQDRRLQSLHVVPEVDDLSPPGIADAPAQPHPQGSEVVHRVDAAVDLTALENKASTLAQRDQRLQRIGGGFRHFNLQRSRQGAPKGPGLNQWASFYWRRRSALPHLELSGSRHQHGPARTPHRPRLAIPTDPGRLIDGDHLTLSPQP